MAYGDVHAPAWQPWGPAPPCWCLAKSQMLRTSQDGATGQSQSPRPARGTTASVQAQSTLNPTPQMPFKTLKRLLPPKRPFPVSPPPFSTTSSVTSPPPGSAISPHPYKTAKFSKLGPPFTHAPGLTESFWVCSFSRSPGGTGTWVFPPPRSPPSHILQEATLAVCPAPERFAGAEVEPAPLGGNTGWLAQHSHTGSPGGHSILQPPKALTRPLHPTLMP